MDVNRFNSDGGTTLLTAVLEQLQMESLIARLAACGDEVSIAFKVNYISEDLLPVTVTSRYYLYQQRENFGSLSNLHNSIAV